jgi:hypothetical protein
MNNLTVYARKEPTTDLTTLKYITDVNSKAKRFDIQVYKDKQGEIPFARFPWHYQSKPTKRKHTIMINGFIYLLEWIN